MVNLRNPIKVYVNGKLKFNKKVNFDQDFMLKDFMKNLDRKQVWINKINLIVK